MGPCLKNRLIDSLLIEIDIFVSINHYVLTLILLFLLSYFVYCNTTFLLDIQLYRFFVIVLYAWLEHRNSTDTVPLALLSKYHYACSSISEYLGFIHQLMHYQWAHCCKLRARIVELCLNIIRLSRSQFYCYWVCICCERTNSNLHSFASPCCFFMVVCQHNSYPDDWITVSGFWTKVR